MSILKTEFNEDEFAEVTYKDGLEDGIKQGRTEGIEEGIMKEKVTTIQRLLSKNKSIDDIADIVDLPIEQVKEILGLVE